MINPLVGYLRCKHIFLQLRSSQLSSKDRVPFLGVDLPKLRKRICTLARTSLTSCIWRGVLYIKGKQFLCSPQHLAGPLVKAAFLQLSVRRILCSKVHYKAGKITQANNVLIKLALSIRHVIACKHLFDRIMHIRTCFYCTGGFVHPGTPSFAV